MTPSLRMEPLVLPSSIDSPEAKDFLEFSALSDVLILETWGNLDLAAPRAQRLESWRDDDYKQLRFYFVRVDGRMVARSSIGLPLAENLQAALVRVDVLNEFTGSKIGQMLLLHAEDIAARLGGITVPDGYVDQLGVLVSRMGADTPAAGLHFDPRVWDAARVRHVEDEWKQSGLESLVSVARYKPSGELAAYSVLQYSGSKPWVAVQEDTLVAKAHRGNRLGMLVKILNLRRLEAERPSVERILTFNAAENEHVVAVNWDSDETEWQKRVQCHASEALDAVSVGRFLVGDAFMSVDFFKMVPDRC